MKSIFILVFLMSFPAIVNSKTGEYKYLNKHINLKPGYAEDRKKGNETSKKENRLDKVILNNKMKVMIREASKDMSEKYGRNYFLDVTFVNYGLPFTAEQFRKESDKIITVIGKGYEKKGIKKKVFYSKIEKINDNDNSYLDLENEDKITLKFSEDFLVVMPADIYNKYKKFYVLWLYDGLKILLPESEYKELESIKGPKIITLKENETIVLSKIDTGLTKEDISKNTSLKKIGNEIYKTINSKENYYLLKGKDNELNELYSIDWKLIPVEELEFISKKDDRVGINKIQIWGDIRPTWRYKVKITGKKVLAESKDKTNKNDFTIEREQLIADTGKILEKNNKGDLIYIESKFNGGDVKDSKKNKDDFIPIINKSGKNFDFKLSVKTETGTDDSKDVNYGGEVSGLLRFYDFSDTFNKWEIVTTYYSLLSKKTSEYLSQTKIAVDIFWAPRIKLNKDLYRFGLGPSLNIESEQNFKNTNYNVTAFVKSQIPYSAELPYFLQEIFGVDQKFMPLEMTLGFTYVNAWNTGSNNQQYPRLDGKATWSFLFTNAFKIDIEYALFYNFKTPVFTNNKFQHRFKSIISYRLDKQSNWNIFTSIEEGSLPPTYKDPTLIKAGTGLQY